MSITKAAAHQRSEQQLMEEEQQQAINNRQIAEEIVALAKYASSRRIAEVTCDKYPVFIQKFWQLEAVTTVQQDGIYGSQLLGEELIDFASKLRLENSTAQ